MPQINKIRIVNFRYNEGRRLIADEIFDFADFQGRSVNSLISLANGGGKSVLVQLMMQPIIPNAKASGRSMDSHFKKNFSNCFIVLEWNKDDSAEKRLIGIAFKPERRDADSGSDVSLKHYLFYCDYKNNSELSIDKLRLSSSENGLFKAEGYDEFRKKMKSQEGMHFFSESDHSAWREEALESVGINHDEWKLIESLNSDEGGLGKYFEKYKNSNNVVDKILISVIENTLNQSGSSSKNLDEIFKNYLESYENQEKKYQKRRYLNELSNDLHASLQAAESLFKLQDETKNCLERLFLFKDKCEESCRLLENKTKALSADIEQYKENIRHIDWEERSKQYYEAQEKAEYTADNYRKEEEIVQKLEDENDLKKKDQDRYECALDFQDLKSAEAAVKSLEQSIADKENERDGSERIKMLRYSVFNILRSLIPETEDIIKNHEEFLEQKKAELNSFNNKLSVIEAEKTMIQSEYNQLIGENKSELNMLKELEDLLNIELSKDFFECYETEEADNAVLRFQCKKDEHCREIDNIKSKISGFKERLFKIPDEETELKTKKSELENHKREHESSLKGYEQEKKGILCLLDEYGFSGEDLFTEGLLKRKISEDLSDKKSEKAENTRELNLQRDLKEAARRGHVHVAKAVIEYFDNSGVKYSACEQELKKRIKEGLITKEQCTEALKRYPALAYGIIIEQEERDKFFELRESGGLEWFPSMVPFFTEEGFKKVVSLSCRQMDKQFFAFYDENCFSDGESYLSKIEESVNALEEEDRRLDEQIKNLEENLRIADKFYSNFNEAWLGNIKNELSNFEAGINGLTEKIACLSREKAELKSEIYKSESKVENLETELRDLESSIKSCKELQKIVCSFNKRQDSINIKKHNAEVLENEIKSLKSSIDTVQKEGEKTAEERSNCMNLLKKQQDAFSNVQSAEETSETAEGDWYSLYSQYTELRKQLGDNLDKLISEFEEQKKHASKLRGKIKRKGLTEEDCASYIELCQEDIEKHIEALKSELEALKIEIKEARSKKDKASEEKIVSETEFKQTERQLKEYGRPLAKEEIKSNFAERRIGFIKREKEACSNLKNAESEKNEIKNLIDIERDYLKDHIRKEKKDTDLDIHAEYTRAYWNRLKDKFTECSSELQRFRDTEVKKLSEAEHKYSDKLPEMCSGLRFLREKFSNADSDVYFEVCPNIENRMEKCSSLIRTLDIELTGIDDAFRDLLNQCCLHGERIYSGLRSMSESSRIKRKSGYKEMIKLNLPPDVSREMGRNYIEKYLIAKREELIKDLKSGKNSENIDKERKNAVSSAKLVRVYTDCTNIDIEAYKIDINSGNEGYRRWNSAVIDNSGAEKTAVYFSIILSLMKYARRRMSTEINPSKMYGTLILDNPFGTVSSAHVLKPMFDMSDHFNVQLICLSDINKTDIVNCFKKVIKCSVVKLSASNNEKLIINDATSLEHAEYAVSDLT